MNVTHKLESNKNSSYTSCYFIKRHYETITKKRKKFKKYAPFHKEMIVPFYTEITIL